VSKKQETKARLIFLRLYVEKEAAARAQLDDRYFGQRDTRFFGPVGSGLTRMPMRRNISSVCSKCRRFQSATSVRPLVPAMKRTSGTESMAENDRSGNCR
jgi:hypothetical protein